MATLRELGERRSLECRLTPDRALRSLDEAKEFLRDRGLLGWASDSALPSLYEAAHEDPYGPDAGRAAAWAKELRRGRGVYVLPIHRGKDLFLTEKTAALADPILRAEIERMEAADPHWAAVLRALAESGPTHLEALRPRLGLKRQELAGALYPLHRCGAVVAREAVLEGVRGEPVATTELSRWDQVFPEAASGGGLDELLVAGVRAAVVAPERELRRWFSWSWRAAPDVVDRLVAEGRFERPETGWVTVAS